jgi:hypothetical protein
MAENGVDAQTAASAPEPVATSPDDSIADQLRKDVETEQALLDAQKRIRDLEQQVEAEKSAREEERKSKEEAGECC